MPSAAHPSRFRLAPDVRPSDYHVHLEPDLAAGRFRGEVRIDVRLARSRTEIVLHAADLTIEHADAEVDGQVVPLRVVLDRHDETVSLRAARALPAGAAALRLRFAGALNRHLRGLYAASSGDLRYAFTQCEAADARRIFPCFDEPAFKARFHVAVTAADVGHGARERAGRAREQPLPTAVAPCTSSPRRRSRRTSSRSPSGRSRRARRGTWAARRSASGTSRARDI